MWDADVAEKVLVLVDERKMREVTLIGEGERGVDRGAGREGESLRWIEVFDCRTAVFVCCWRLRWHLDTTPQSGSVTFVHLSTGRLAKYVENDSCRSVKVVVDEKVLLVGIDTEHCPLIAHHVIESTCASLSLGGMST